ncbi:MAG: hypothetical protein NHG36_12700 [Chromatiaceae bacterium]|nr:hypothetical protein [Candidatus Thioaporhodococcus sediminis]
MSLYSSMKLSRATLRTILALCLLLLQGQLLAASLLGCRHAGPPERLPAPHAGCHLAAAGPQAPGVAQSPADELSPAVGVPSPMLPASWLDCHKCNLQLSIGVSLQGDDGLVPAILVPRPPATPLADRHFYRFVPEPVSRPPIPTLS